jgi:hypothetical protein
MPALHERARYEPDFGLVWPRLPILITGALVAAAGVAWLLKFAYFHNWYLIILLPAGAGLGLGGVLYALVAWSRCRNYWLAGTLGVVAGLVAYLGYYQLCLADMLPPGLAWRGDLLPRYIALRMQTDVAQDLGKPDVGGQPKKPFPALNWFAFACELLVVTGAAAAIAWNRARRAYCPQLGRWMRQETAMLPASAGPAFCEAVESGRLAGFVADTPAGGNPQTSCRLTLEYAAPPDDSVSRYPIYASLAKPTAIRPWHLLRDHARTHLLRQVELEPAEVLTLLPLFPKLAQLLTTQHPELRDLPPEPLPARRVEAPVSKLAEITPVPEPYRQRVRAPGYALRVNLRGAIPLVFILGGAGLLALGIWQAVEGLLALGCAAAAAGAAGIAWGIYVALYCASVYENRWIQRRLRQELGERPDALVDAQSPDSVFVSLIPRESFVKVRWTMSSDLMLLKIDEPGRQLVMEGDSDRYRIPAESITVCEPQCFFHPIDINHANQLWMVRLVVAVEQGSRELLLSVGHTRWTPMTNDRRHRAAEEMCQRIDGLRS